MCFKLLGIYKKIIKVILSCLICFNINAQPFTLNGTIKGKDSGYAVLWFRDMYNNSEKIVAKIKSGTFQFKGEIAGFDYVLLDTDTASQYNGKKYAVQLFIEPGTINIKFSDGELDKSTITGSKSQNEYENLKKQQRKKKDQLMNLSIIIDTIESQLKNGLIDAKTAEMEQQSISKKYQPIALWLRNDDINYIKRHTDSYVSLQLLYYRIGYIPNDSVDAYYSKFSDKIKNSSFGYRFNDYYKRYRKAIGAEYPFDKILLNENAPDFKIYNTSSKDTLNKKNLQGKVLILEFWGLYCFPCLKANSDLQEIWKGYDKDKLEIIAINVNDNKDTAQVNGYIKKNKLFDWIHVFTNATVWPATSRMFNGNFDNYFGLGVPRTIIIDKKGILVYKNYGYSTEEIRNLKLIIGEKINDE